MNETLRINDEYHDHPRPGLVVPVWSREQGGYFIQLPPIQQQDENMSVDHQWSKQDICSYLGVPAEMIQKLKAKELEHEEMFREWIRCNPEIHSALDFASGTDKTAFTVVGRKGHE